MRMVTRKGRLIAALTLTAALALAGTAGAAGRPTAPDGAQDRRASLTVADAPAFGAPSQDNYAAVIANHFANPAAGQALIETWTRQTYSDLGLPINNQGFGRAVRVHNVLRISLRVVLHTRGGTNDDDATGPTFNNGTLAGNPRIFNATSPSISTGGLVDTPQFCESWTTVHWSIRWTDNTLTSGRTLEPAAALWNDNCYFIGAGP